VSGDDRIVRVREKAREKRRRQFIRFAIGSLMFALLTYAWVSLATREIPAGNAEVLIAVTGALTGSVLTIVAYYFGDSDHMDDSVGDQ